MKALKDILIKARKDRGLSQEQVANIIGVSQKSYSMYESGERNPKHDKIVKLERLFDIVLPRTGDSTKTKNPLESEGVNNFESEVASSLREILNNLARARAEVRAVTEYHVMKDARNNEKTRQALMEQINSLIGENLQVDEETGNVIFGGN